MNIVFHQHNEIDKQKWDEVIASSHNSLPYAYSWYLDCVCPNWNALVGDDYQYVFPLTANTKFGIKYLYQPYFAQQLGLFSKHNISPDQVISFLKAIPDFYKLIEINLNFANTVSDSGFQVSKRKNFELQLDKPYTEIKKFYSDNQKRNIAKAEKSGLFVTDKITIRQVIDFFKHDKGVGLDTMKEICKRCYRWQTIVLRSNVYQNRKSYHLYFLRQQYRRKIQRCNVVSDRFSNRNF
ncbi:MAG: hypothetical protein DYH00_10620 [Bacteroidetes bacterium CHB6]|nr:hypothetical protein [Bacteroidetes bacterium CHB6]